MRGPRSTRVRVNARRHGNGMKGDHTVTATDAGRASGNIRRLRDRNSSTQEQKKPPQHNKARNEKPTAQVTLSDETDASPQEQGGGEVRTHQRPPAAPGRECRPERRGRRRNERHPSSKEVQRITAGGRGDLTRRKSHTPQEKRSGRADDPGGSGTRSRPAASPHTDGERPAGETTAPSRWRRRRKAPLSQDLT